MKVFYTSPAPELAGQTLILPAVTPENIGELTCEALIHSLNLVRIGHLESDYVLPVCGNDPYSISAESIGTLTTALELYASQDGSLFVLQQRSPAAPGTQDLFAQELASWIQQGCFKQAVVLSSLPATFRHDPTDGSLLRFSTNIAGVDQSMFSCGWQALEEAVETDERTTHGSLPPWPLVNALEDCSVAYVLGCMYVSEGDNVPAALVMTQQVLKYLEGTKKVMVPVTLQQPCSWVAVYGRAVDSSLYTV